MEIKIRPLNEGELFPCSYKRAKELFKNTSVVLNFAYTSRVYGTFENTKDKFYLKNKIQGKIISSMYMYPRQAKPLLNFYVIKKSDFTSNLQNEFEKKYLPAFYDLYQVLSNANDQNTNTTLLMVELLGERLILHQLKLR